MAVESILENEALLENAPASCAQALLEWGTTKAMHIASDYINLGDEDAEAASYPRMKALRQMLKKTAQYLASTEPEMRAELIAKINELAQTVYGSMYRAPDPAALAAIDLNGEASSKLSALRSLFEQENKI
jgi:hypothetical protein